MKNETIYKQILSLQIGTTPLNPTVSLLLSLYMKYHGFVKSAKIFHPFRNIYFHKQYTFKLFGKRVTI